MSFFKTKEVRLIIWSKKIKENPKVRLDLLSAAGWLVSRISPSTCYGLASNTYLSRKTECHKWHAINSTPITALEIHFNWLHLSYWPFMKPLGLFWNIRSVIYRVRAFLKHLPKNISANLIICAMWVSNVSDTSCVLTRNVDYVVAEGEILLTKADMKQI